MTDKKLNFLEPTYTKMGPYELSFNEKNHRKISKANFKRLKEKIKTNVYEPIKIWKKGNTVLCGNQRLAVIRHLIENENFNIDEVNVAIYDVDKKTAKFIQLADNEHDGQYDFERLLEDFEEIEELGLADILDPKILKKLNVELSAEMDQIVDIKETEFDSILEIETATITIKNVPKNDLALFYETVNRIKKVTGQKNEWKNLKLLLNYLEALSDKEILEMMNY